MFAEGVAGQPKEATRCGHRKDRLVFEAWILDESDVLSGAIFKSFRKTPDAVFRGEVGQIQADVGGGGLDHGQEDRPNGGPSAGARARPQ